MYTYIVLSLSLWHTLIWCTALLSPTHTYIVHPYMYMHHINLSSALSLPPSVSLSLSPSLPLSLDLSLSLCTQITTLKWLHPLTPLAVGHSSLSCSPVRLTKFLMRFKPKEPLWVLTFLFLPFEQNVCIILQETFEGENLHESAFRRESFCGIGVAYLIFRFHREKVCGWLSIKLWNSWKFPPSKLPVANIALPCLLK